MQIPTDFRSAPAFVAPSSVDGRPIKYEHPVPPVELLFRKLVSKWKRDTRHWSNITKMILHPSYLRIIGMGSRVLPLLLKELSEHPDHWLVALNAITGEDPAPEGAKFDEAVAAWIAWGKEGSYLA